MARCCVMKAYFRPDTTPNKIAWAIFGCAVVLGAILVPLGASRMTSCASQWNACVIKVRQTFIPDPEGYCQPILYQCHFAQWWNAFIWGIVLFITAGGVLCYFCCCAVPPGYTHVSATAYTVTGTYQVGQPLGTYNTESMPLFHTPMAPPVYSSGPQHMFSPYGQQLPPPPPYQYAQLYPTHAPGIQMQAFIPPTYTVTLGPDGQVSPPIAYDPSFSGGVLPATALAPPALMQQSQAPVPSHDAPLEQSGQANDAHPFQQQQQQQQVSSSLSNQASGSYPVISPMGSSHAPPAGPAPASASSPPSFAFAPPLPPLSDQASVGASPPGGAGGQATQEATGVAGGLGGGSGVGAAGGVGGAPAPAAAAGGAAGVKPVPDLLL